MSDDDGCGDLNFGPDIDVDRYEPPEIVAQREASMAERKRLEKKWEDEENRKELLWF